MPLCAALTACAISAGGEKAGGSVYAPWGNGPSRDPSFFPIAVWLQNPRNAPRYKAAGINLYVGLWKGPTESQLAELKRHGMPVICAQNTVGLKHRDDPVIVGWMHGDEPDNAQSRGKGKGYGPPVPPARVMEHYRKLKRKDPSRPVLLNLGQGVAWDGWHGRGVRTNHPEDYPEYIKGCDIVSFDIYPGCHRKPAVAGKLWFVADGVTRLRKWSGDRKVVWNCIECTRISNPERRATPGQVHAEVWMSLIRGSRGLIYFAHQFKPGFIEAGLLADKAMLERVTRTNRQIRRLAPVLNSPGIEGAVVVASAEKAVPIEIMVKRHHGALYIFSVAMRGAGTTGTFTVKGKAGEGEAEVLGEGRKIPLKKGGFRDSFKPWGVHLYRLRGN
jgi:hypothetical protein